MKRQRIVSPTLELRNVALNAQYWESGFSYISYICADVLSKFFPRIKDTDKIQLILTNYERKNAIRIKLTGSLFNATVESTKFSCDETYVFKSAHKAIQIGRQEDETYVVWLSYQRVKGE